MPREAINRVSSIGRRQGMPGTITYANRHGLEIGDTINDFEDDSSDSNSSYVITLEMAFVRRMVGKSRKVAGMWRQLEIVLTWSSVASHLSRQMQVRQSFGTKRLVNSFTEWLTNHSILKQM
jgi:hypothetical protein